MPRSLPWRSAFDRVAVLLRGPCLGAGAVGDRWQVPARLSASPELCTAFTGLHKRTLAVLTPRSTTEAMAASATRISATATSFAVGLPPTGPGTLTASPSSASWRDNGAQGSARPA